MDFTIIIAAIISFGITAALGFLVIPYLRKLKFGQTILDIGPNWHKEKQGTPTMGGVMMVAGVLFGLAFAVGYAIFTNNRLFAELHDTSRASRFLAGLVMALCMCAIGFVDDYVKVVKKRNLGLTARQKTFLQLFISALYLFALYLGGMRTTNLPFLGEISITSGFGIVFWPIAVMFIYGFVNAVNLTDGIDGLASSVTLVVACAFMFASSVLNIASASVICSALAGACAGFICWNAKPAKVFMGDTGSMFLGGMVVAVSFSVGRPVLLIFAGIMYLMEAVSDIIQVAYYKKTKKRIFKMAPLHHHFEMCGWSEQKIVFVFSLVTFVGCAIALLPVIFDF